MIVLKHIILLMLSKCMIFKGYEGEMEFTKSPHEQDLPKKATKESNPALFSSRGTPTSKSILIHYKRPPGISYHHLKNTLYRPLIVWSTVKKIKEGKKDILS